MFKIMVMISVLFSFQLQAKVKCDGGISFADKTYIKDDSGKTRELKLNGVGLKKVFFFNVFYAALYLEKKSSSGSAIMSSSQHKVGIVHVLRNASKGTLTSAWDDEFERLCGSRCKALEPYHNQLVSYFRDVRKNETLYLINFPDRFEFEVNGNEFYPPIRSAEYSDLMQNSLFGPDASDKSLKEGLLGKKKVCK